MHQRNKRNKPHILFFAMISLILLVLIFFVSLFQRGKSVVLTPGVITQAGMADTFYDDFYQKDSLWAEDRLGASRDTMAQSGCLTCCMAAAMTAMDIYHGTPGELNELFTTKHVYNENGAVLWNQVSEALPGVSVRLDLPLTSEAIQATMMDGYYPIVKVRRKSGAFHWVTLMETDSAGKSFICLDPLEGRIDLEEYGNRIYAVRVVSVD